MDVYSNLNKCNSILSTYYNTVMKLMKPYIALKGQRLCTVFVQSSETYGHLQELPVLVVDLLGRSSAVYRPPDVYFPTVIYTVCVDLNRPCHYRFYCGPTENR